MGGSWDVFAPPVSAGNFACDTMLLLTDGSVLVHDAYAADWLRLSPDSHGNYPTGNWSALLPMAATRQFFSSAVLSDGTVYVIGGEYSSASGDTPLGEVFDPSSNSWSPLAKPAEFDYIQGDAPGAVLSDGRVLLGDLHGTSPPFKTAIWNPADGTWTPAGSNFGALQADSKQDACNEETWTLLPDGSVLTVEVWNPPNAERYVPAIDEWVSAGSTPTSLPIESITDPQGNDINVYEIGPAILLPDGRVFAIGATGQTALYTPPAPGADPATSPGAWTAGPSLPQDTSVTAVWPTLTASDAPAVLQTNGKVLLAAGSLYETGPPQDYFSQNMQFLEFDPATDTIAPFPVAPFSAAEAPNTWPARFLLLPTAQILLTCQSGTIWIYTPDASDNDPPQAWRPVIASCPAEVRVGQSYTLSGTQLNGLSQAVSYGDDAQMATNYPLVRISQGSTVTYLPTSGFSTMGVATGPAVASTTFTVPYSVAAGQYELTLVANGITSTPVQLEVQPHPGTCLGLLTTLEEMLNSPVRFTMAELLRVETQLALCLGEGEVTEKQYKETLNLIAEMKNSRPLNGATPRLPSTAGGSS